MNHSSIVMLSLSRSQTIIRGKKLLLVLDICSYNKGIAGPQDRQIEGIPLYIGAKSSRPSVKSDARSSPHNALRPLAPLYLRWPWTPARKPQVRFGAKLYHFCVFRIWRGGKLAISWSLVDVVQTRRPTQCLVLVARGIKKPLGSAHWRRRDPALRSLVSYPFLYLVLYLCAWVVYVEHSNNPAGCGCAGEVFDGMPHKVSRLEFDAGASPWASLQPDILGVVLRLLPCLADRASVRSVCRHWRAGSRNHALPPPLPLLVLPEFRFSSLSVKGELTPPRRVPVPKEVEADDIRCVGSFGEWLMGVTPSKERSDEYYRDSDGECFLVNVFSLKVIRLPQLSSMRYNFSAYSLKTLRVINGLSEVHFGANDMYTMSLCGAVLSASPDSGSKYIVAASSNHQGLEKIALWQPGMTSWHVCSGVDIDGPKDLAFFQGKLYVLLRYRPRLFAFELEEDDRGFMVSRVQCCLTELLHDHSFQAGGALNMVVWRGSYY